MTYVPETWVDYTTPCIDAAHLNAIEHGIDIAQGDVMVLRGLTAAIPATDAELVGRLYFATDAPYAISRDNGAGWDVVGYTNDLFTALGTLQVGSAVGTAAPLGIGAAAEVLTVVGGTAAWAAAGAGGAWTLIAETILGAPAATVTFAAIPGIYRHLALVTSTRTDRVDVEDAIYWRANGDAGNNYDFHSFVVKGNNADIMYTRGRNASWGTLTVAEAANSNANAFAGGNAWFYYYATGDRDKIALGQSQQVKSLATDADLCYYMHQSHWNNVAPITDLLLSPGVGPNFIAGCRFALYGIT